MYDCFYCYIPFYQLINKQSNEEIACAYEEIACEYESYLWDLMD